MSSRINITIPVVHHVGKVDFNEEGQLVVSGATSASSTCLIKFENANYTNIKGHLRFYQTLAVFLYQGETCVERMATQLLCDSLDFNQGDTSKKVVIPQDEIQVIIPDDIAERSVTSILIEQGLGVIDCTLDINGGHIDINDAETSGKFSYNESDNLLGFDWSKDYTFTVGINF